MKLISFDLVTKENTTDYETVEKYSLKSTKTKIVPVEKIIEKDFIAELTIEYENNGTEFNFSIMSYDVGTLMEWVKKNHPDLYELIPSFRIDQFQYIADNMKSSSYLLYQVIDENSDRGTVLDQDNLEPDDFIPQQETVEMSFAEISKKGFYTELHCYPNTPIGFWNFYGTDFQSLLDHIVNTDSN